MTQYIEVSNKLHELLEELADQEERTVASVVDEVLMDWLSENHQDIVDTYEESDDSENENEPD